MAGVIATGGADGLVRLWDPLTSALVGEPVRGHTDAVRSLAAGGARRTLLASASDDRTIRVWDPVSRKAAGPPLAGHERWVHSVAFLTPPGGGPLVVSGGGDRTVRVWEPHTGQCRLTLRRRTPVRSVATSGALLAIGDDEGVSVIEIDAAALAGSAADRRGFRLAPSRKG